MESNKDPSHIKRIKKVSYKLNIPEEVIELALHYTSEYIKNKISKVEVSEDILMSKEEFEEKLPTILLPSLGYLRPNYYKYKAIHNKIKLKKENSNNIKNK